MDNIKTLYITFDGRIGRKTFWLGVLGIAVAGIILGFILTPLLGGGVVDPSQFLKTDGTLDSEALSDMILTASSRAGWANLVIYLIMFIPITAIILKRRHDRGSAGMEYWVYAGLAVLLLLLQATGIGYSVAEIAGFSIPVPTTLTTIVMFASGALGIYMLVVCGFLKGDDGDNSWGPNPIG